MYTDDIIYYTTIFVILIYPIYAIIMMLLNFNKYKYLLIIVFILALVFFGYLVPRAGAASALFGMFFTIPIGFMYLISDLFISKSNNISKNNSKKNNSY